MNYKLDNQAFYRLLVLHVRLNNLRASELKLQITYLDDEYDKFILVIYHVGDWEETEKLLLLQTDWRTTMLGAENHKTLVTMNNLASTYRNRGRWDDAEKLGVDVMKLRKALLGPDHPFTLSIMCNLTSTYSHQGRWDEAEKLLIDVTNASKAKLGQTRPPGHSY